GDKSLLYWVTPDLIELLDQDLVLLAEPPVLGHRSRGPDLQNIRSSFTAVSVEEVLNVLGVSFAIIAREAQPVTQDPDQVTQSNQ
ncbi:6648_t:CDS:2, partial [Gigaspora rosea]